MAAITAQQQPQHAPTAKPTAVITGAGSARGIGHALAERLATRGWQLALIDVYERPVRDLADALASSHGVHAVGIGADIADPVAVDTAITTVEASLPPVTALINIAGISSPVPFLEMDLQTWTRVLNTNATGTFLITRRLIDGLVDRRYGRIVNLSSTAAQNGGGTYSTAAYAASKAAIEGFTRAVALETAPFGVTVNAVAPATIDTDIMGGPITEDRKPAFLSQLPVGRIGTPGEVAALIEFLIGAEAGYITGATYNINGGVRIG